MRGARTIMWDAWIVAEALVRDEAAEPRKHSCGECVADLRYRGPRVGVQAAGLVTAL